jgi:predicted amidohydrolase
MPEGILKIATCQFPVSAEIEANAGHIVALMREAAG